MTVEQVAEALLCSPSKVSRLETGQRGASARDIRDLSNLYRVADATREHLDTLAREGRGPAWWQPYELPYATYVGLEAAAVSISDFEPGVFPGLLQTPAYARAIHEGAMPRLSPAVIDQRIEVRQTRQQILTRAEDAPEFWAVLDEAVLHRAVGGPAVMSVQIDHVMEACQLPNVMVQILAFGAGAHPALDSTFTLLEFADPVPGVVYVEGLVGQVYLERPQDVYRYRQVFDRLRKISLGREESIELMIKKSALYKSHRGLCRTRPSARVAAGQRAGVRGFCITLNDSALRLRRQCSRSEGIVMYETGSSGRDLVWCKAQSSVGDGACVELAPTDGMVAVRDSKDPDGPVLRYTAAEWHAFLDGAKKGEFDHLV